MSVLGLEPANPSRTPEAGRQIALVDLLDRLLGTGVVLSGDLIISIAGVDLVEIRLRALITSVRSDLDTRIPHLEGNERDDLESAAADRD
jgi:hypothetical protein